MEGVLNRQGKIIQMIHGASIPVQALVQIIVFTETHVLLMVGNQVPEYIPTDWLNHVPDYQQAYNPYKYDLTDLIKFTPSGIYRHDHMINNCTTLEEELNAVNLDHMSTIEIDELFYSIFKRQTLDEEDDRQDPEDYFSAHMMCMKKHRNCRVLS